MSIPGVTVLYTSKYLVDTTWGWSWAILLFGIIAILGLIGFILGLRDEDGGIGLIGIVGLLLGVSLSLFIFANGTPIYGTEYNVTIDNDVTFSQVADQYEISSMNGRLYTLRPHTVVPWTED